MTTDPPLHPLAYVMAANGWSHRDLAQLIARDAASAGVNMAATKGKVWKWQHGTVPDRVTQLILARRLGVDAETVDRRPWPLWLPAYDGIRIGQPGDHAGVLTALAELVDDVNVDRRGFMVLTGRSLVRFTSGDFALGEPLHTADGTRIDAGLVADIDAGVPRLRRIEARLGGGAVRPMVHAELTTVIELLRVTSYNANEGRQLYRIAAELARVAGWAAFDDELHAQAQRYWSTGLYAARAAGDRLIAANIKKSMSLQCLDFARPGEAVQIAEATVSSLKSTSPRVSTMFALRQARALAAQRDIAACLRLIASTDADAAAPHEGDPEWIGYFDTGEYCAQVASCYLDLGDFGQADSWFVQALDLMPASKNRDRATYLLRRAEVAAARGDHEQAAVHTGHAMPLMREAPSARNTKRLQRLQAHLPTPPMEPR